MTRTLKNAVGSGRVVHAYLFCGPRGTGKTSTARILAKAVNCLDPQDGEPCNRCASCVAVNEGRAIDLIEIDAASNRGIDDARDLRDKIKFSPAESRYKVYIIDEAHMLTSEASNALLKTLEEPPEHAILILATTEAHKILPTISSRCQRFDFRRIPLQAIGQQLGMICEREGITVEPGVLDRVSRMARGSLRDAESLLDQLVAYCGDEIVLSAAKEVLGISGEESLAELADALRQQDLARGFGLIDQTASTGADLRNYSRELVDYLRALMVVKSGADTSLVREYRPAELARLRSEAEDWEYPRLLTAMRVFGELEGRMRMEPFNQLHLEIAFMEAVMNAAALEEGRQASDDLSRRPGSTPKGEAGLSVAPEPLSRERIGATAAAGLPGGEAAGNEPAADRTVEAGAVEEADPGEAPRPEEVRDVVSLRLDLATVRREWPGVVKLLRASGGIGVAMVLDGCVPLEVAGETVVFGFENRSWQDKVERLRAGEKVAEGLSTLFGRKVDVRFRYGIKARAQDVPPDSDPVVKAAVQEFGFRVSRVEPISD